METGSERFKYERPSAVRSLSFTPLRLNLLEKDILEAANEPLFNIEDILESDEEKEYEDVHSESVRTNEENEKPLGNCEKNECNDCLLEEEISKLQVDQNFEKDKENKKPIHNKDSMKDKNTFSPLYQKKTCNTTDGMNTIQRSTKNSLPKIQCSIEVGSLLKTPLTQFKSTKGTLSVGKFENTPVKFKGAVSGHFNGEILKIDKVFGSLKRHSSFSSDITKKTPGQIQNSKLLHNKEACVAKLPLSNGGFMFNTLKVKNKVYVILKELGRGGSSVVYACFDPIMKSERAIKKVFLSRNQSSAVEYVNEIQILHKLQKCDRIIKMYDSEVQEDPIEGKLLLVVLERGEMDLSRILKRILSGGKPLALHVLMFYWMEMLYAVKEIHENGIIHSDLKPANFIKAEGSLKLIDFGIASCVQKDMTSVIKNVAVGSFEYISPEALLNDNSKNTVDGSNFEKPKFKINFKSDVWSLGCILHQMVYGRTPFQHFGNISAKLSAIMDPNHEIKCPYIDRVPKKFINTIEKCLQYIVKQRPSVNELIQEYEDC